MTKIHYSTPTMQSYDDRLDNSICVVSTTETSLGDMPETNMDITF